MPNKKVIQVFIDDKKITAWEGQTVLELARANRIDIPTLCYHPDIKKLGSCRLCLIEIEGVKSLQSACTTEVFDGMIVKTKSEKITKARRINLELIFAQHEENCSDCILENNCDLINIAKKHDLNITRYIDRKTNFQDFDFNKVVEYDASKCIDCGNCISICHKQNIDFLTWQKQDASHNFHQVTPSKEENKDCIYCGQCILHCPVGAFQSDNDFEKIIKPIEDPEQFVIFQIDPAVRTAIGEEWGLLNGTDATGQIIAAIKKLGANYVFDTGVGADIAILEQAKELVERLKSDITDPLISSSCPAWVKYIEFKHPNLILNLSKVASPHIILGTLIKTYWAAKEGIDIEKINVITLTSCVARKYEIRNKEINLPNTEIKVQPVDLVLTTREFSYLLKKKKINLKELAPKSFDTPFNKSSGAGLVYGASGNIIESILRTASDMLLDEKNPPIESEILRESHTIKEELFDFKDTKIKTLAINGLSGIKKILNKINNYNLIEVAACFGGCPGGGGQPVPSDKDKIKQRIKTLYDLEQVTTTKKAHENEVVKDIYENFFDNEDIAESLCHTVFSQKSKEC